MATISSTSTSSTASTTKTSSTTASSTTKTASASSINKSTANSILTSLGSGSGVDTDTLVTQLVDAQFAAKRAQITAKTDKLTAQISDAATLKNFVSDFAKAVNTLVTGGSLATQPNVSDPKVAGATAISGAPMSASASANVTVTSLATVQTVTSAKLAKTDQFGSGKLTINIGTANYTAGKMDGLTVGKAGDGSDLSFDVDVAPPNDTLSGIAAAINAKNTGVTAAIITDADGGAFLSLKGQSGTAQAFSVTGTGGTLDTLNVGPNATATSKMSVVGQSANAKLSVDGVSVERPSNEISDLVPGIKLTLAGTGSMTLTGTRPDTALTNGVKDFVETFNQLLNEVKQQTNAVDGSLRADPAAKQLLRNLQGFASKTLLPDAAPGSPSTLAGIGVTTDKTTGELTIDDAALTKAMKDSPDSIQAMFNPNSFGATGINAAMQSLKLSSGSTLYGLGATDLKLRKAQDDLTKETAKIDEQSTRFSARLTQQYASMNSRVSAYKQTQSFMKQQIDGWYKSS
ncbi:flagellar filament capping protein FliD [Sphingomonas sp. 8AM]|uniref:flagellar filament capping protein FliD n=1 Tax=Sphingomonas sp. 8AM TaxID=2653170 RepID=UPI0012F19187|nr:flagellar filament capping protein FliD [Sphingomonas sp. 8AM]VXC74365.1 Flagellar hook-associated protein 2 [Sphingomonas sp. 8AM]